MQRTFIIAEAGVNHNGSVENAIKLIDVASESGADAVKFQTFSADALVSKNSPKAAYQKLTTEAEETQFEMLKKLELSEDSHQKLIDHAGRKGIEFLSTPFDLQSLFLLNKKFNIKKIKIPSGEITNAPFLVEIARCADEIILSTGMSTLAEVEAALGVIAFGFIGKINTRPSSKAFAEAYSSQEGQEQLRSRLILLHATTEYPAPPDEINLNAMDTMSAAFGLRVGYSDHSQGVHIPVAAVAKGASVIEKHFTLDRSLPGPDHKASLEPTELKLMVQLIRDVEKAMGDGIKRPTPSEWKNREVARKSLVATDNIGKGEIFTEKNLSCKRPGSGISPIQYWDYIGQKANADYPIDGPIT
ncbi:N-acetylneuraminate synthase [Leptospira ilyithenensis]|uniref:N-acetylneuraminate synthase n=1 Tax=Leptospira ilyithenensis TaxID=2484901 RepID=A0A4R9LK84_9LEPT|nr:N-acetylneuraminate synthase [Leptospira ilyithenensis]TGN07996.1 N-acetylneuraminate synthase [Leptospira ilyithenensis]